MKWFAVLCGAIFVLSCWGIYQENAKGAAMRAAGYKIRFADGEVSLCHTLDCYKCGCFVGQCDNGRKLQCATNVEVVQ